LSFAEISPPRGFCDTCVCQQRNTNIPPLHAVSWGTTLNQDTVASLKASNASTIIRPAPPERSTLCTAAQMNIEEPAPSQTNRIPGSRHRETRICFSASVNKNKDDAALDRFGILTKSNGNHASLKMRKSIGIVPSQTIAFPTTVVRIWRIDR
jgi:hypothetical protein